MAIALGIKTDPNNPRLFWKTEHFTDKSESFWYCGLGYVACAVFLHFLSQMVLQFQCWSQLEFYNFPIYKSNRKKKKAENQLGINMLYAIAVAGSSSPDVSLFLSSTNVKYKQHSWFGSTPVALDDELIAAWFQIIRVPVQYNVQVFSFPCINYQRMLWVYYL